MKKLFGVGLAYETAAASASFFRAANADGVLFAKMSVAVKTAVANVTVDFLIKFVIHNLISPLPYANLIGNNYYVPRLLKICNRVKD